MAFYLQPPVGSVSYQKLEEFGLNRIRFLARLAACKDDGERGDALMDAEMVNWSECLIAGSVKDKISHFLLRVSLAGDAEATKFLCDAESWFFRMRLDSFSTQEWLLFFKTLKRQLSCHSAESLQDIHIFLNSLKNQDVSWISVFEGIANTAEKSKVISLPFQTVLRLVAKRRVVLSQGCASVPFCLIPDVLEELFNGHMTRVTHMASQQQQGMFQTDSRMSRLSAIMKRMYHQEVNPSSHIPLGSKVLTLDTMTSSRQIFPPCMARLMEVLDKHHRLCHRDRIQLTLFLKELGLPVHQALLFWKREYSKPPVARLGGAICGHDWQGSERRYIYNIRHLYGLEGRRVSYVAHSCGSIQGRQLSCNDSGGCPFVSLEPSGLITLLSREGLLESDIEDIVGHVKEGRVQKACKTTTYRKLKGKASTDDLVHGVDGKQTTNDTSTIGKQNSSCNSCVSCSKLENSECSISAIKKQKSFCNSCVSCSKLENSECSISAIKKQKSFCNSCVSCSKLENSECSISAIKKQKSFCNSCVSYGKLENSECSISAIKKQKSFCNSCVSCSKLENSECSISAIKKQKSFCNSCVSCSKLENSECSISAIKKQKSFCNSCVSCSKLENSECSISAIKKQKSFCNSCVSCSKLENSECSISAIKKQKSFCNSCVSCSKLENSECSISAIKKQKSFCNSCVSCSKLENSECSISAIKKQKSFCNSCVSCSKLENSECSISAIKKQKSFCNSCVSCSKLENSECSISAIKKQKSFCNSCASCSKLENSECSISAIKKQKSFCNSCVSYGKLENSECSISAIKKQNSFCSSCVSCGKFKDSKFSDPDKLTDKDVSDDDCSVSNRRLNGIFINGSSFSKSVAKAKECCDSDSRTCSIQLSTCIYGDGICDSTDEDKVCDAIRCCGRVAETGVEKGLSLLPRKRCRGDIGCDSCTKKRKLFTCSFKKRKHVDISCGYRGEDNDLNGNSVVQNSMQEVEQNAGIDAKLNTLHCGRKSRLSRTDSLHLVGVDDHEKCFSSNNEGKDFSYNSTRIEECCGYTGKGNDSSLDGRSTFYALTTKCVIDNSSGYSCRTKDCHGSDSGCVRGEGRMCRLCSGGFSRGRVLSGGMSGGSRPDVSSGDEMSVADVLESQHRKPSSLYWAVQSLMNE